MVVCGSLLRYRSLVQLIKRGMSNVLVASGKIDRYNGVTVDCSRIPNVPDSDSFEPILKESLSEWQNKGIRASWFKVPLQQSAIIPALTKHGYKYHHAKTEFAMLVKWLSSDPNNIPEYAFTNIGVGALVVDEQDRMLVIKEKHFYGKQLWKYPGGYSSQGEDFAETAEREVFEETGIKTRFHSVVTFRHQHHFQFGCSDLYIICHMSPVREPDNMDLLPKRCSQEIDDVAWIPISEMREQLSDFNKHVLDKFLDYRQRKIAVEALKMPHILKNGRFYTIYSVNSDVKF